MWSNILIPNLLLFVILLIGTNLSVNAVFNETDDGREYRDTSNFSTPTECARTCRIGEKPKTCYYHFTVEAYATLTAACDLCRSNSTTKLDDECQCIEADGYEISGIMTANRQYPGPSIMVCLNDYVVVDVLNVYPGAAITIHWHGVFQKNYQYYDGVPFVTQCPIETGTTFRYQWRAQNSGTHFWHAHTGLHKAEGLEGALIIREPKPREPNNNLWDHDNLDNFIFITDWLHDAAQEHYPGTRFRRPRQDPDNFLINGKGQWTNPATGNTTTTPLAVFEVEAGGRYRFRLINSCSLTCPVQMTIQDHELQVIATDGANVKPVNVTSITSFSAERYDFIINADKPVGNYWIQVRGLGNCAAPKQQQFAVLRYKTAQVGIPLQKPSYEGGLPAGVVLNQLNVRCHDNNSTDFVCVSQLQNADPVPLDLLAIQPDVKLFLPFGFYQYTDAEIFKPGVYRKFDVNGGEFTALIGNISNQNAPSAMISQFDDIPKDRLCSIEDKAVKCKSVPCECIHVEDIPLNALVELILVDEAQVPGLSHPFHLHGQAFHIIGEGCSSEYNITSINVAHARRLDRMGMMKRRLKRPPGKDTFAVPNNGFSIIRFIADNPGYWLFHCHFLVHLQIGMSLVFRIGVPDDLPPVPPNFPMCGDFTPRIRDGSRWYS